MNSLMSALSAYSKIPDEVPTGYTPPPTIQQEQVNPMAITNTMLFERGTGLGRGATSSPFTQPPPAAPIINLTQNMPAPTMPVSFGDMTSMVAPPSTQQATPNAGWSQPPPTQPTGPVKPPPKKPTAQEVAAQQAGNMNSYINAYSSTGGYNAMLSGGNGAGYGAMNTTVGGKYY